jgi:DNA primase
VVASCGTALTSAQARTLKRFTSKVVLNFDPDAAGQGAAARSSELLVAEGFQVNVVLLPEGADPDMFIRRHGGRAYVERLTTSRPYLDFLLDREAERHDLTRPDSRREFLNAMLSVAATIPEAAARDQFADRLSHKAQITEAVVRDEIRKAAAHRQKQAPAVAVPLIARVRPAEQGLLWLLVHRPIEGLEAIGQLDAADMEGLVVGPIFALAASLSEVPPDILPGLLRERLNESERALLERAASPEAETAASGDCVHALKRLRYERELAVIQQDIEGLVEAHRTGRDVDRDLAALWERKKELLRRLDEGNG